MIVVVNNPIQISEEFRKENQRLVSALVELKSAYSFPIDVLDYTDPGIQNGVGEARKIGMNYAVAKYLHNPKDLIASLDADCSVDLNYVSTLFQMKLTGTGFTLFFKHALDHEPMIFYELYLRYLRWGHIVARSPFAYYSIGSSLGTNVQNYTKVGGMISKSATEDFHFLNKLRKLGPIQYWTQTSVMPSTRQSERVTLGTGYFISQSKGGLDQAISKLMIPHPSDFEKLQIVLSILGQFDGNSSLAEAFEQENLSEIYQDLHQNKAIEKIYSIFENTTSPMTYQNRLIEVIDALETLRILRGLWKKRKQEMSQDLFLRWANQLWKTNDMTAKDLLMHVRTLELNA